MEKTVKTIPLQNGKLFAIISSNRILLYECEAEIEIVEHSAYIPVLGKGRVITQRDAVLLITFEHLPKFEVDERRLSGFDFEGEYMKPDGSLMSLKFDRIQLLGDLDLTASGSCTFELQCSREMLDRLKRM
ncbi:hypothetical protein AALA24_02165 [Anaerovoracaceae bacterium 42-11]